MKGHNTSPDTLSKKKSTSVDEKDMNASAIHSSPVRDLLQEKRSTLRKGPWALDESLFCTHFGEATYQRRWFLEGLIELSRRQPSFSTAWALLESTYRRKHPAEIQETEDPTRWLWSRLDIKHALDEMATPESSPDAGLTIQDQHVTLRGGDGKSDDGTIPATGGISKGPTEKVSSRARLHAKFQKSAFRALRPLLSKEPKPSTPGRRSSRTEAQRLASVPKLQTAVTDRVSDIENKDRQEFASALIKMFTEKAREDTNAGDFRPFLGSRSAEGFGLSLGLFIEFEVYRKFWTSEAKGNEQYEAKIRMLLEHVPKNAFFRELLFVGKIPLKQLCLLSDEAITRDFLADRYGDPHGGDLASKIVDQPTQNTRRKTSRHVDIQPKKKSHKKGPVEITHDDDDQDADFIDHPNPKRTKSKGKKRPRSATSPDLVDDPDPSPSPLQTHKPHSKRIQSLNKITQAYIQPEPADVAVTYLDTSLLLPPDAPLGWPHLIDLTSLNRLDTTGLQVPDMIVTVLCNHSPDTLARFMDMSHGFTFHVKEPPLSESQDLVIVRTATTVTVGFVDEGKRWTARHRYGLRASVMARWTPLCIEEFTTGEENEEKEGRVVVVDDVVSVMVGGEALAFQLLEGEVWVPGEGARVHVRSSAAWRT